MTLYQLYVQYCHATNTPAELIMDREEFYSATPLGEDVQ